MKVFMMSLVFGWMLLVSTSFAGEENGSNKINADVKKNMQAQALQFIGNKTGECNMKFIQSFMREGIKDKNAILEIANSSCGQLLREYMILILKVSPAEAHDNAKFIAEQSWQRVTNPE